MKTAPTVCVAEVVRQGDSHTRRAQVLRCTVPGCCAKLEVLVNDNRKPPSVVMNMARRKGWFINEGKRVSRCPEHARGH